MQDGSFTIGKGAVFVLQMVIGKPSICETLLLIHSIDFNQFFQIAIGKRMNVFND